MMIKIAHFGDLHASEKTKEEALKAVEFIFDECKERDVHAILNCGDTFDGPITLGDKGPVNELLDLMFSRAQAPQFIIEGTKSHDIPGSIDIFEKLGGFQKQVYLHRTPASYPLVKTHESPLLNTYVVPAHDLDPGEGTSWGHISFLPALTKSYLARDITASPEEMNQMIAEKLRVILSDFGAKAIDSPKPHILMGHFTVAGSETSTGQVLMGGEIILSPADIALANADYVAMAHIHKAQKIEPNIYYAGSPYHLNFGELEEKGFNIVTFDDDGNLADVEFVKNPHARSRQTIDVRFNPETRDWDLSEKPHPGADVRIRLYAPMHEFSDEIVDQVEATTLEAGVHTIKVEKIPTPENRVRAANLSTAQTLRDQLIEYAKVKGIEAPESALLKADQVEEVVN
ncbi:MAG: metallophosphoesterase [Candidatus Zixiibacteriota bacterium]|nr:MAG: metallophosphoesterase [candidate division Zixibacteria bacterium]